MDRRTALRAGLGLGLGFASLSPLRPGPARAEPPDGPSVGDRVARAVAGARSKGRPIPGVVGAIVRDGRVVASAASGLRKLGSAEPVRVDDPFHLGSCTKAMTATLVGTLVDDGKLGWDETLAEAFGDRAGVIHPEGRAITLRQLLDHTSGLPGDVDWNRLPEGGTPADRRRSLLGRALDDAPRTKPGSAFAYSNLGYVVLGLMAEEASGESWESLIRRRVFEPLGMASAGLGPPGPPGKVEAPWGHLDLKLAYLPDRLDNPPVMGPAGLAHASIGDWAKFAAFHLGDGTFEGRRILRAATLEALHTPTPGATDPYAGGWIVADVPIGGKAVRFLTHGGSNRSWFADVWLDPGRKVAYLAASNAGGAHAEDLVDGLIAELMAIEARPA